MAVDDETQDAVRRILKERPPEDLPRGAETRLRQRLDEERTASTPKRPARVTRTAGSAKKRKSVR